MALAAVIAEIQWMHQLLKELGLRPHARGVADETDDDDDREERHVHAPEREMKDAPSPPADATSTPSVDTGVPLCACLTPVYSDNQSAISQVRGESDYHARSKHIDIRHHFVKAAARREEVDIQWVESAKQLADVFTKPLDTPTFLRLRQRMRGTTDAAKTRRENHA